MDYLTNWKTTLLGAAAGLVAAGHLLNAFAHGDTSTVVPDVTAILAGFGLISAKDGTK